METIAARVIHARESNGWNQTELAKQVKCAPQAIQQIESGHTKQSKLLPAIAEATGFRYKWLEKGIGPKLAHDIKIVTTDNQEIEHGNLAKGIYALIPYYRVALNAGHGNNVEFEETTDGMAFRKSWLTKRHLNVSDLAVVKVEGESMAPRLQPGDIALIDLSSRTIRDGKAYAIRIGNDVRIKRLVYRFDGELVIRSDNPDPRYRDEVVPKEHFDELEIIGQVVWSGGDW